MPIPTRLFDVSRFKSPASIFKAVVLLFARSTVEALTNESVAPFNVIVSFDASPSVVLPVTFAVPLTERVEEGAVVPTPTLVFEVSIPNIPPTVNAVAELFRFKLARPEVEVKFNAPVVKVNPFEAVRVEEKRPVPETSKVAPGAVVPIPIVEFDS